MAVSLVGTYTNQCDGSTLQITSANDANGELKGTLTMQSGGKTVTLTVVGVYHYYFSTGPMTSIAFGAGVDDDPMSVYEGWAGVGNNNNFNELVGTGGRSTIAQNSQITICPVGGPFVRQ